MTPPTRRRLLQLTSGLGLAAVAPALAAADRSDIGGDWSPDIAILRQAWESLHPGLHRYNTPEQMSARLDRLTRSWAEPGDFRARLLSLTRVTAAVRCGHTYPSPYNAGLEIVQAMYPGRTLVPFRFRWLDRRMIVTRDDTGRDLFPVGAEILAINGVDTGALLRGLVPLARADGGNDAKRISLMEVRGDDGYETFDIHLPLLLPLQDEARFTLGDGRVVTAGLMTLEERRAGREPSATAAGDANPWTLERTADGVAVLTMPGWALYNSSFDWRTWLGGVMDDLAGDGVRGLIVDLRGNEGGLDCGDLIASRLIDADLALPEQQRWVRYRRAPDALHPYLDTWDRSFLDWGEQAVESPQRPGFYRLTRFDDDGAASVIRPAGRRFNGAVAVLCDASNSSATFGFAQLCKSRGLARLIGEPTGGNRRGINGGAFFFLKLPVSGLEVDLPLIAGFPETLQPDAPIEPDQTVRTTVEDVIRGHDPQKAAARNWIIARAV